MDAVRIAVNKDSVTAVPAKTPILVQDVFWVQVEDSKSKEKKNNNYMSKVVNYVHMFSYPPCVGLQCTTFGDPI